MRTILIMLKMVWLDMFEPPWRQSSTYTLFPPRLAKRMHWRAWIVGWAFALSGLVLGALVAPQLIQTLGLTDVPYKDWLAIVVAVVMGILVQFLGVILLRFLAPGSGLLLDGPKWIILLIALWRLFFELIAILLPIIGISYSVYRYLTGVAADQRATIIAFVGGPLVKTFAIPLIKGIVTGALFRWFMKWLRGGKGMKSA